MYQAALVTDGTVRANKDLFGNGLPEDLNIEDI